jgi:DNA-binding transcriptional LysR family regulator
MSSAPYAELMAFMAIHEARSFRDAALRLGVTPSALSRTLRRLEDRLGSRLLNRTTRSVSPTEAGALLYGRLVPIVTSLEEAVTDATALCGDFVGTVRLNLPRLAAELIVMPRLAEFCASYPGVRLEMVIDDGLTDVVAKGFDAGIRIGKRLAQDMIAVRLTPAYRIAVVGSPAYFAAHGVPDAPHDLTRHRCINYRWAATGQLYRWHFTGPEGVLEVDIDGPLIVNDTDFVREAAIAGLGLACLPEAAVEPHIARGALVRVLQSWCPPFPGFYLYHPGRHHTPPALRAMISFFQAGNRLAA